MLCSVVEGCVDDVHARADNTMLICKFYISILNLPITTGCNHVQISCLCVCADMVVQEPALTSADHWYRSVLLYYHVLIMQLLLHDTP